jgi:hypothetical protein
MCFNLDTNCECLCCQNFMLRFWILAFAFLCVMCYVVGCMNMEAWRQMLFHILTVKLGDDEGEVDFLCNYCLILMLT